MDRDDDITQNDYVEEDETDDEDYEEDETDDEDYEEDETEDEDGAGDDTEDEEDAEDGTEDDDEDVDDDCEIEVFPIMGSTKEKRYQVTLEKVRQQMTTGPVAARVKFERDNPQDKNAIKGEAFIDQEWKIFGCIKKRKIPKLTKALRNDNVIQCCFLRAPRYKFNVNKTGENGWTCQLLISKHGAWDDDDKSYTYNADLTRL